jgi:hypothetical protein
LGKIVEGVIIKGYNKKMRRDISQLAPSLSVECKEIILGSLLGEGSLKINKRYKNARFSFRHSRKYQDYFLWKVERLKEISGKKCWWIQKDGKLKYQSLALPELTEIYNFCSKRGRFKVRRRWLNLLTPRALAVWWMDDGSLVKNSRQGVFCTDRFSLKEQKILARYLYKVWKIRVKIGKSEKGYYRLWIRSTEMLKKFLRVILPYITVESMLPKVILLYKDSQLQQRWISELERLSKFSPEIILHHLAQKKAKWKEFRE